MVNDSTTLDHAWSIIRVRMPGTLSAGSHPFGMIHLRFSLGTTTRWTMLLAPSCGGSGCGGMSMSPQISACLFARLASLRVVLRNFFRFSGTTSTCGIGISKYPSYMKLSLSVSAWWYGLRSRFAASSMDRFDSIVSPENHSTWRCLGAIDSSASRMSS